MSLKETFFKLGAAMVHSPYDDYLDKKKDEELNKEKHYLMQEIRAKELIGSDKAEDKMEGQNILLALRLQKRNDVEKDYKEATPGQLLQAINLISGAEYDPKKTECGKLSQNDQLKYTVLLKLLAEKVEKLPTEVDKEVARWRLAAEANRVLRSPDVDPATFERRDQAIEYTDGILKSAFRGINADFFILHKFGQLKKKSRKEIGDIEKIEGLLKLADFNKHEGAKRMKSRDILEKLNEFDIAKYIRGGFINADTLDALTQSGKGSTDWDNSSPEQKKMAYRGFLERYGLSSWKETESMPVSDMRHAIQKYKTTTRDIETELGMLRKEIDEITDRDLRDEGSLLKKLEKTDDKKNLQDIFDGVKEFFVDGTSDEIDNALKSGKSLTEPMIDNIRSAVYKKICEDAGKAAKEKEATEKKKSLSDLKSMAECFGVFVDGKFGKGTAEKISDCRKKIDSLDAQLVMMEEIAKELGDPEETKMHKDDFEKQKTEQQKIISDLYGSDKDKKKIVESFLKKLEDCKAKSK